MKCNEKNSCSFNPAREKPDPIYPRLIRDHEHGECPHRVDGNCQSFDRQVAWIRHLRFQVKKVRHFRNTTKDLFPCNFDGLTENLVRSMKPVGIKNPKTGNYEYFLEKPTAKFRKLYNGEELGTFFDKYLDYILYRNIHSYSIAEDLFKIAIMVQVKGRKITVWLDDVVIDDMEEYRVVEGAEYNFLIKEVGIEGWYVEIKIRRAK